MKTIALLLMLATVFACNNKPKVDNINEKIDEKTTKQENKPKKPKTLNNILEYYNDFTKNYLYKQKKPFFKYTITKKGEKWVTNSSADYEIDVIVDFKNWYLDFNDEGTGGGSMRHTMTMFKANSGKRYFAFSEQEFDGLGINQSLQFYWYENNKWQEAPSPFEKNLLSFEDFIQTGRNAYLSKELAKDFGLLYELPQHGTSLKVKANLSNIMWKLEMTDKYSDLDKDVFKNYQKAFTDKTFSLKWDRAKEKFTK